MLPVAKISANLSVPGICLPISNLTPLRFFPIPMNPELKLLRFCQRKANSALALDSWIASARIMIVPLFAFPLWIRGAENVCALAPMRAPIVVSISPIVSYEPEPSSSIITNFSFWSFSKKYATSRAFSKSGLSWSLIVSVYPILTHFPFVYSNRAAQGSDLLVMSRSLSLRAET